MFDWLRGGKKKRERDSLGMLAVKRIAKGWLVDADRIRWVDDGFDWWPGSFQVEVRAGAHAGLPDRWKLSVRTKYLQDVPIDNPSFETAMSGLGMFASSYSLVQGPRRARGRQEGDEDSADLFLFSSVYIDANLFDSLPQVFGALAILQPIDAEIRAIGHAELVGAEPAYGPRGKVQEHDELLELVANLYAPAGEMPSWWSGASEFYEFDDENLISQGVAITNDDDHLALDVPLGNGTALIRLWATERHIQLGNGLLVTLQLPSAPGDDISRLAAFLNQSEAADWTNIPQLGCWHRRLLPDEKAELAHTSFVPNVLGTEGLATNFALWTLARARWAHNMLEAPVSPLRQ
jgi:hypothetical protein